MSETQLERSSKGGKICFWRGQNFWVGLVFIKFSVDIQKKVIAPIWSTFLRGLGWFPQKSHHFETAARVTKVWVGMLGSLGGGVLFRGAPPPYAPPPSSGPDPICLQKNYLRQ